MAIVIGLGHGDWGRWWRMAVRARKKEQQTKRFKLNASPLVLRSCTAHWRRVKSPNGNSPTFALAPPQCDQMLE